ncbi:MAG TPA: hypothetical protein VGC66_23185 [Pyrinomonadaceae bacterium]|jgi:hypothetical protein
MVRLYLTLAFFFPLCVSGCTATTSAQNSNRLDSCAQARTAFAGERARTEKISETERGPKPIVNPQDGAVAPVATLMQQRVAVPYLRETYQWSEVTPFEVPDKLPPWIRGSYWSVMVSYCRVNSNGEYIASREYQALIRNNKVVWLDFVPQKIEPSKDAEPLFEANAPDAKTTTRPALSIKSIKAMPFNESMGFLGGDALANGKGEFWNSLHTSLLVLVELSGERGFYERNRKIEFTARTRGQLILTRTSEIGVLNENGKYYASFYLYGGFCSPVSMEARIQGQPQSLKKTLDFGCGE